MNKQSKLFVFALVAIIAVLGAVMVVRKSSATADESKHIIVITKGIHIFWNAVQRGAEQAAKERGYTVSWIAPERDTDREKQIQMVEDSILAKNAGIVLAPLDTNALVPVVEKMYDNNIPCAIIDAEIATDKYVTFAATNNYAGGELAAHRMAEILGGKGNVLVIRYVQGVGSTQPREEGFIDTIKKSYPNIKILADDYGMDTVETALQLVEDQLSTYPDVQGIFACNASTTIGAKLAVEGQKRDGIKIIGFDYEDAMLDGLKSGQIDSLVLQNPYKMGYLGVNAVVDKIEGKEVPKHFDTGIKVITRENLNEAESQEFIKNN